MDRRAGANGNQNRSRSNLLSSSTQDIRSNQMRDGRRNGSGILIKPEDTRYREELQNLIHSEKNVDNRETRGRSRSPKRHHRVANRHTSPNRRVSWHDSVDQDDPRNRNIGQSPEGRRRGREQSPRRGREQSPRRGRQQSPQSPRRGREQSPRRGRQQSPQSPRRGRKRSPQSPRRGRKQSPQKQRQQSPQRSRGQFPRSHSSEDILSFHISETHDAPLRSGREITKQQANSGQRTRRRSRSRSRSRSPHRQQRGTTNQKKPYLDARELDAETAAARITVMSMILHVIAIATSIMIIVPLSLISSRWKLVRGTCPIYVHNNIGFDVDWGNANMMVCNIVAYLPLIILAISFCLVLFHYGILHTWYTNKTPPKFALTRKYAVGTMLLVFVEAVVAWVVACLITDGFRQTCLSFELTPAPEDRPISCKYGYDDRDETYMFQDLNTFQKLMIGMLGSWVCSIAMTILFLSSLARLCCCRST